MNNCNKVHVTFENDAFRLWYIVVSVYYTSHKGSPGMRLWSSHLSQKAAALSFGRLTVGTLPMQMRLYRAMAKEEGIRKEGGMWRDPTIFIVIYKYIKYAIKIVNSFPLQLLQRLLLEECSPNPNLKGLFPPIIVLLKWQVPLCCFFTTEKFQTAYTWLDALNNINIQCLYFLWIPVGLTTGPQMLEKLI